MEKTIKVQATKVGQFGDRVREVGEIFEVPASLMTAKLDARGKVVPPTWFEEVVEEQVTTTRVVRKSQSADDLA